MRKEFRLYAFLAVMAMAFVLSGVAQQTGEETAVDPVCGMTVKKAEAKVTFEYKGTTYYFCAEGCKNAFAKDPEKYLQKAAEPKGQMMGQAGKRCQMMQGPHGQMMGQTEGKGQGCCMNCPMHGKMAGQGGMMGMMECPLHSKDVEMKVENTADGVAVKITAKNAELVKKIQECAAMCFSGQKEKSN